VTETIEGTTAAIERELDLAASPDRVWRALTDSDELAAWFPQRASIPAKVGEIGWMEWDGHPRFAVRVEHFEPERRLAWRWASSADPDFDASATLVEWTLEPTEGGGTILRLRETGFESPYARRGNVEGWLDELGELLALLAREPWERGIRRTWRFRSSPDRVWRAFSDPAEFSSWWGGTEPIEIRPGFEGWFAWPTEGRYAMRIERVEPPTYLSWRWTTKQGVSFDETDEILRTEWALMPSDDGGTVVHLLETGFRGPDNHRLNSSGWDSDVSPALGRHLGEPDAAAPSKG
jgi:uncharacterized protein YndB with AHSA1/START domain